MRSLLDVNVLLALLDIDHVDHLRARHWLTDNIAGGWASCALTQNGFVRILSQPRYPNPVPVAEAMGLLARATETAHHEYWPCSTSLLDLGLVDSKHLLGYRQVTDVYLLALATEHGGQFVTFDRGVSLQAVSRATEQNLLVL